MLKRLIDGSAREDVTERVTSRPLKVSVRVSVNREMPPERCGERGPGVVERGVVKRGGVRGV